MDPSDDYKWIPVDCSDLSTIDAVPVCEYPNPPENNYIQDTTGYLGQNKVDICIISKLFIILLECLMVPDTRGWHSPSGTADGSSSCAELCKSEVTEAMNYQWAIFTQQDSKCYCRLTVEQGHLIIFNIINNTNNIIKLLTPKIVLLFLNENFSNRFLGH